MAHTKQHLMDEFLAWMLALSEEERARLMKKLDWMARNETVPRATVPPPSE